jgi:hypothetical protein
MLLDCMNDDVIVIARKSAALLDEIVDGITSRL